MVSASANAQPITVADVSGAFIHADLHRTMYIKCGPEFGEKEGQVAVLKKALYGLREASKLWMDHMSTIMTDLGWKRSKADENLWRRREKAKYKGQIYYEYCGVYVDDLIVVSHDGATAIKELETTRKIKFADRPETYLGGEVRYNTQGNLVVTAMNYIGEMVAGAEGSAWGKVDGARVTINPRDTPMRPNDHPEFLNGVENEDLNEEDKRKFQKICGQILWVSGGLGRIDVAYAAASLSRFAANPKTGHMERAHEVIGYLKKHPNLGLVVDARDPEGVPEMDEKLRHLMTGKKTTAWHSEKEQLDAVNEGMGDEANAVREMEFIAAERRVAARECANTDWEEELDEDDPEPLGKGIRLTAWVDANWAHDYVTRKSITGIIVCAGVTPIYWKSTRQSSVSSSTFEAELAGLRTVAEVNRAIRIGMRAHGMKLKGATRVMCDNQAAVQQATKHDALLKKRHTAISWHRVREAVRRGEMGISFVPSAWMLADLLTKPTGGVIFNRLVAMLMYRVRITIERSGSENSA